MEKMILIPEWHLKEIENTLRIANNIHHSLNQETCFDRCVCKSWDYARQALNNKEDTETNIKFIATRFAHECRLNGCATNDDTCKLWDKLNTK